MLSALAAVSAVAEIGTTPGMFRPSEGGFYDVASARYTSFLVNGAEVPVLDGYNNSGDYLGYDVVRFTAPKGDRTIARVTAASNISTISVHPLALGIEPVKIDDRTYEFEVPDPAEHPYYLYVKINGRNVVVCRDVPVPAPVGDGVFNVADALKEKNVIATDKTAAAKVAEVMQSVIDKASEYGASGKHGVVYVPDGYYYLGNIILKSNIELFLSPGAVLRASDNRNDYRVDYHKNSLGRDGTWWISTVNDPENPTVNVKISGYGTIDANGYYWQKRIPSNADRFCITALHLIHAENITVDGITVLQTPMWGTMLGRSNDITFTNVKFLNSTDANENDGIDVNESQRVLVDRAIGIALDDPFSTKTWMGQELFQNWTGEPEPLDDVTFNHCVSWTYCGGFKMGHGAQQKQSNVKVLNGVVLNSGRAIGVEPKYVNDAPIGGFHDILFENIDIEHASGEGWLKILAETPGVGYPPIKNVTLRNINIREKGSASSLRGTNDEFIVDGVTFDNITMLGNPEPVKTLAELNITNTGFYKNVVFYQDATFETDHVVEAEYCNEMQSGTITLNNGADNSHPEGCYVSGIASGKYLLFRNVDFGSSAEALQLRIYNPRSNFKAYARLDNPVDGRIAGEAAFARDAEWCDIELPLDNVSGLHDLYISFEYVSGPASTISGFNYFVVKGRVVHMLEGLQPAQSDVDVNIYMSQQLKVEYLPADAYNRDLVWSIVSQTPSDAISLSADGVVSGLRTGTAVVEARSASDSSLSAVFNVNVVDELSFRILRIEAEDADEIYSPYHYDAAMSIGAVNDPDDPSARGINSAWNTNFAVFRNVDFGEGAVKAAIRKGYVRGSAMEMWIDPVIDQTAQTISGGTKIAEIEYPAVADDWSRWQTFETPVSEDAKGVHTLVLYFKAGGGSATNQNYGALNWIEFTIKDSRPELEALVAAGVNKVSAGLSARLSVGLVPADARQTEVRYELLSANPEGCATVTSAGLIHGIEPGSVVVRASSVEKPEVYIDFTVDIVADGIFSVTRIEAEDAAHLVPTYQYDASKAIAAGAIDDTDDETRRGYAHAWHGNFAVFTGVDFADGLAGITVRKELPRNSGMEIIVDPEYDPVAMTLNGGETIADYVFSGQTTGWGKWYTWDIPFESLHTGVHTLVFLHKAAGGTATNQDFGGMNWFELRTFKRIQTGLALPEAGSDVDVKVVGQGLVITSPDSRTVAIYGIDGRCVSRVATVGGQSVSVSLPKGIYIVEGMKFAIY